MGADSLFSYATLFGFLFALARISGVFAFLPLAVFRAAPEAARDRACARVDACSAWQSGKRRSALKHPSAGWWRASRAKCALGACDWSLAGHRHRGFSNGGAGGEPAGWSWVCFDHGSHERRGFDRAADDRGTYRRPFVFRLRARIGCSSRRWLRACGCAPPESFTLNKSWAFALIQFAGLIFSTGLRLAAPVIALLLLGMPRSPCWAACSPSSIWSV